MICAVGQMSVDSFVSSHKKHHEYHTFLVSYTVVNDQQCRMLYADL